MKNEKAIRRYRKSLRHRPRYIREVLRILPVFLILMLLADIVFTQRAADVFTEQAKAVLEDHRSRIDSEIGTSDANFFSPDFNEMRIVDVDEEKLAQLGMQDADELFDYMYGELKWRLLLFANSYHWNEDIIGRLYGRYQELTGDAYPRSEAFLALYSSEGRPVVVPSPQLALTVAKGTIKRGVNTYQSVNQVYFLDLERLESVHRGLFDRMCALQDPAQNGGHQAAVYFESFYIKDDLFLPTKVELYGPAQGQGSPAFSAQEDVRLNGMLLLKEDLSDCDFSGYEELFKMPDAYEGGRISSPMFIGLESGPNYHKALYESIGEGRHAEAVKKLAAAKKYDRRDYKETRYTAKGVLYSRTPNETLYSVIAIDYDFFRDYKGFLAAVYAAALVLAVLISLFWGFFTFQRKRLSYEVDSYRRRTTNAMAHDLKSPLMAISGYAENIYSGEAEAKTKDYAQKIRCVVREMDQMIANILDLAKLEESCDMNRQELSLRELTERVLTKYELKAQERGLNVIVEGDADIRADLSWMGHLIDNLISNAVKYSRSDSEIFIEISPKELAVRNEFSYELTKAADELTEPFVKGDDARNNVQGNGLGLGIANQIAALHGFTLHIRTEGQSFEAVVDLKG